MTDVFGAMFTRFDTNNNSTTNESSNNFQTCLSSNLQTDKAMLQLNNYSSIDYNSNSQNMYAFQDDSNCFYNNSNQYRMQTEEEHSPQNKPETIHSGHFMVSEIDDADNEVNVEEDVTKVEELKEELIKEDNQKVIEIKAIINQPKYYNIRQNKKNWNIDYPKSQPSLDMLFKKMNLGFDSKLTSPKWKQFPGLKISLKAKIRVNNLIWRAWHIKCRF